MTTAFDFAFVRREEEPVLAPPTRAVGAIGWVRSNLFSSVTNTILTLLAVAILVWVVPPIIRWAFVDAVWTGNNREACATGTGACWAFVRAKFGQFMYGRYPFGERWRVNLAGVLLVIGLVSIAIPRLPFKRETAVYLFLVYPVWAFVLLVGGNSDYFQRFAFYVFAMAGAAAAILTIASAGRDLFGLALLAFGTLVAAVTVIALSYITDAQPIMVFDRAFDPFMVAIVIASAAALFTGAVAVTTETGRRALQPFLIILSVAAAIIVPLLAMLDYGVALPHVETPLWGGLLVTLVVALVGIAASLPIGILLALGRRSKLPVVRFASIVFIEFVRGVPLITVLFMASVMLPLFLPAGINFDKLLRALIGVALFSAAYMAEVVRGGLQAIPRGQYEAGQALGLGYWRRMRLIVLPQALKIVIPGIVNSFISLFKDTSLVLIIGLFDLLGIVQQNFADANWAAPGIPATGYVFAAAVFWLFCFTMSRYSIYTERRLHTGYRR